jgi:hypothetical protein
MVGGRLAWIRSGLTADAIPDKNSGKLDFANVDSLGGISTRVAGTFSAPKYTP